MAITNYAAKRYTGECSDCDVHWSEGYTEEEVMAVARDHCDAKRHHAQIVIQQDVVIRSDPPLQLPRTHVSSICPGGLGEWHSVERHVPNSGRHVIVWCDLVRTGGPAWVRILRYEIPYRSRGRAMAKCDWIDVAGHAVEGVTHWTDIHGPSGEHPDG